MRLNESSAALLASLLGSASYATEAMVQGTGPKANESVFGLAMLDWPSMPL
jgi:hypothetical protein